MGTAQFYVSAEFMATSVQDVIDLPWPEGTQIVEENESEWHHNRRLRVVIQHPDIPAGKAGLPTIWCNPSWWRDERGELRFSSWNFREDWE